MNKYFLALLFLLVVTGQSYGKTVPEVSVNCSEVVISKEKLIAYIGWPFALSCKWFLSEEESSIYEMYDSGDLTLADETNCIIKNAEGQVIFNTTTTFDHFYSYSKAPNPLILPDLKENDNIDFQMILNAPRLRRCMSAQIHLNVTRFQQQTCQEFNAGLNHRFPSNLGSYKIFSCETPDDVYPKVHVRVDSANSSYAWLKDCSTQLSSSAAVVQKNSLRLMNLKFDDAGVYTCAVTHNGMTRYMISQLVCLQHRLTFATPIIMCDQPEYFIRKGNDLKVNCKASFGDGSVSETYFRLFWNSHSKDGERTFCRDEKNIRQGQRMACSYKLPEKKCFISPPPEEERRIQPAIVPLTFIIRNLKDSDFGRYQVSVVTRVENSLPISKYIEVRKSLSLSPKIEVEPQDSSSNERNKWTENNTKKVYGLPVSSPEEKSNQQAERNPKVGIYAIIGVAVAVALLVVLILVVFIALIIKKSRKRLMRKKGSTSEEMEFATDSTTSISLNLNNHTSQ